MMVRLQPWKTEIVVFNISGLCDLDQVVGELLCLPPDHNGDLMLTPDLDPSVYANLFDVRDRLITPKVLGYFRDVFDYPVDSLRTKTWGLIVPEGEVLVPHYHTESLVTSVFYPTESKSRLTLFDPRGNACRGYPSEIRDRHFSNFDIVPNRGDVYIFPSYIHHYVSPPPKGELRLSMATDYFLHK